MKTKTKKVAAQVILTSLQKEAAPLVKRLADLGKITDQNDYDKAATTLKKLKELAKLAEDRRRLIVVPMQIAVKNTNELFSPFFQQVEGVQKLVKDSMLAFLALQDERKTKLEGKLESGEIKKVSTFMRKSEALETHSDAAIVRIVMVLVKVDEAKTPRAYLVPDEASIKKALAAGKKVPGWKLEEQKNIAI